MTTARGGFPKCPRGQVDRIFCAMYSVSDQNMITKQIFRIVICLPKCDKKYKNTRKRERNFQDCPRGFLGGLDK